MRSRLRDVCQRFFCISPRTGCCWVLDKTRIQYDSAHFYPFILFTGVDIPGIKQVIMVRPPSLEHSIIQAMGRAGRLTESGQRAFSLLYILFNAQDCTGLPPSMVQLLKGDTCVKKCLRKTFEGNYATELVSGSSLCCNRCDRL